MISTANSVLAAGLYFGSSLCSLSILGIEKIGWRDTYSWIGLSGLAIGAASLILVREPERGAFAPEGVVVEVEVEEDKRPLLNIFTDSIGGLYANPVTRYCTLAGMLRFFGMFAIEYYIAEFYVEAYPSNESDFATTYALV